MVRSVNWTARSGRSPTILRDNGIKLQQLIENLLEFSAWQARHAGLEISEFRLRPLIKSALETHQLTCWRSGCIWT